ncbi:MAG: DNA replication and repair protein RecF [Ignavibacteriales bacterium]|nr:MAG: DNA replication and repair protein RecF [Ignavibacteriales bacterium]
MILSSIRLKNFRLHKEVSINFSDGINYIVGGNGKGKTTILESIYFLCTTKSSSSRSDSEAVSFSENGFEISGIFKDRTENKIKITYSLTDNKKNYLQDNKIIGRASEIIGKYPVVLLTPEDHSITQGSPSERRRLADSIISQASETYLKTLIEYNKVLKNRSSLLSQFRENKRYFNKNEFDSWTEKLADYGTLIIEARIKFISAFNEYISESYFRIMNREETPSIKYSYLNDSTERDIKKIFIQALSEKREEELRRASNLVGPHKDDFVFEINGINLKTFGSQGQHKTFQTAIRFAQFFYLKEISGKTPLFLLDDVFGELDSNRAKKISEYLSEVGQTFITLTDFSDFSFLKKKETDLLIRLNEGSVAYA